MRKKATRGPVIAVYGHGCEAVGEGRALSANATNARQARLLHAGAALVLCAGIAYGAEDVAVTATRQGSAIAIDARATLRASLEVIWQTVTDYDHLADFVPGMETSRVIERHGNVAIVEQAGRMTFLFFAYPIQVVVRSEEHYPLQIRARLLSGNLKQLVGAYRIDPVEGADDRSVLRWSGLIEADTPLPLFITVPIVRANVKDQFLGLIREIERRERARPRPG